MTRAERPVGENSPKKQKKATGCLPPGGGDWDQRVAGERDACYFNEIQFKHLVLCNTSSPNSHCVPKEFLRKSSEILLAGVHPTGSQLPICVSSERRA